MNESGQPERGGFIHGFQANRAAGQNARAMLKRKTEVFDIAKKSIFYYFAKYGESSFKEG